MNVPCLGPDPAGRGQAAQALFALPPGPEMPAVLAADLFGNALQSLVSALSRAHRDVELICIGSQPVFGSASPSPPELAAASLACWGARVFQLTRFVQAVGAPLALGRSRRRYQLLAIQIPIRRMRPRSVDPPSCLVDSGGPDEDELCRVTCLVAPELNGEARQAIAAVRASLPFPYQFDWAADCLRTGPAPAQHPVGAQRAMVHSIAFPAAGSGAAQRTLLARLRALAADELLALAWDPSDLREAVLVPMPPRPSLPPYIMLGLQQGCWEVRWVLAREGSWYSACPPRLSARCWTSFGKPTPRRRLPPHGGSRCAQAPPMPRWTCVCWTRNEGMNFFGLRPRRVSVPVT